jgi:hypothetical protein
VWKFLNTMERGLTPAFALLMFLGIWRWRRVWARRDHQALFYTALALVGGICINLWWTRTPCFRYPLPIALLGSVFAALGLMAVTRWLLRIGRRRQWPARWQPLLAAAPLVLVIGLGLVDALTRNYQPRIASARLGRWVAAERRPATVLGSPDTLLRISAHYAGARYASFAEYETVEEIAAQARVLKPDVILLSPRRVRPERLGPLVEDLCRAGFAPIDPSRLPPGCQHMSVLVPAAIRPARSPQRIAQWDCSPSLF